MTVTITGKNSYQRVSELHKRVAGFVGDNGDMALEKIDCEEASYDRVRESLESMPFLAPKKMVVLRSASVLKEFTENAERLLKNLPDSTELIIYEPTLDKRTSYAKLLKKATDFHEYKELDERGLIKWLIDTAKAQGATLGKTEAALLIRKIGPNQQMLASELEKLVSASKKIDKKLVNELVEALPQSSIFDLLEAAFKGDKQKTLDLYNDQRQQNVEPHAIIGLLAWQLHVLAICTVADGKDSREIASQAKLNPYVVSKSMAIAKRLSRAEVKQHIRKLQKMDEKIKTSAVNADDALTAYLLGL